MTKRHSFRNRNTWGNSHSSAEPNTMPRTVPRPPTITTDNISIEVLNTKPPGSMKPFATTLYTPPPNPVMNAEITKASIL